PGRIIDREANFDRRLFNRDAREGLGLHGIGDGISNHNLIEAAKRHDISGARFLDGDARKLLKAVERPDLLIRGLVLADKLHVHLLLHATAADPANRDAPDVVVVDRVVNEDLKWRVGIALRSRYALDDGFEKRTQ